MRRCVSASSSAPRRGRRPRPRPRGPDRPGQRRRCGGSPAAPRPSSSARRSPRLVVGSGATAALVVGHDAPVPVHLLQWDVPDRELQVVVLVPRPDHGGERRCTAELERMARVGTWRYELATGTLHRSEPLQELYRERGVEPDGSGGPVEGEQVALLVRSLRAGAGLRDHEAELALPGVRLSCRAEVEFGPDGAPARLIGVVRDVTGQHELEARARHAARRFADLAALVPTGVAIVDRGRRRPRGQPRPVRAARRRPRSSCAGCRSPPCAPTPCPIRARPRWTAPCARRCPAGCARWRPAPRTATRWRPCRCCAATGRPCGASWPSRRRRWTTTAGSGCWPAPTSASNAARRSCCAARAPSTS